MPTIFSHAAFAVIAGKSVSSEKLPVWFWLVAALCSVIPDADAVAFVFRIPYASMFGHRGITHSIAFAFAFGALVAVVVRRLLKNYLSFRWLFVFFSLATLSHTFFDMLTDGGLGVALFAPFSGHRYFLPWQPIEVSPIGTAFFSLRGVDVILSEFIWVWLPAVCLFVMVKLWRSYVDSRNRS